MESKTLKSRRSIVDLNVLSAVTVREALNKSRDIDTIIPHEFKFEVSFDSIKMQLMLTNSWS